MENKMENKIIFLDIDGTLITKDDELPDSAVEACKRARQRGHKIFLCSGRSLCEIYQFVLDIGFDGVISAAGARIDVEGTNIYKRPMSEGSLDFAVDYLSTNSFSYLLESDEALFLSPDIVSQLENYWKTNFSERGFEHSFIEHIIKKYPVKKDYPKNNINKILFAQNTGIPFEDTDVILRTKCHVVHGTLPFFGPDGGEISDKGTDKGAAVRCVINHLSKNKEDAIAVGDGSNDGEMFENCAFSIAMGNAKESLKSIASMITNNVSDNGLYNAFKKIGLI